MKNISLKKISGVSKRTGKEFVAFELRAGQFSRLFFVNNPIEFDYLDKLLTDNAHKDFKAGDDDDEELFD